MKPVRVLHVVTTVNPDAGGVAESILVRGREMLRMGHEVEVVSFDQPDAPFVVSYPLKLHALGSGMSAWQYHPRLMPWIRDRRDSFDAVVVDGIWQYHGMAVRRALQGSCIPYFVFPHGMLDPWFKRRYPLKHLKKWMVWPWADYRVLRDATAVLFTCEMERRLAAQSFWLYRTNDVVVPFGTAAPPPKDPSSIDQLLSRFGNLRGRRLVLYLGRVHPKKGCDILIEAFGRFVRHDDRIDLVIAGPVDLPFKEVLCAQIENAGLGKRVHWLGPLHGSAKWAAFYASDLFVLPSHQENFGITVVEALGCGLPVLITNKINIWREISDAGGYVVADNVDGLLQGLREWHQANELDLTGRVRRGRDAFEISFSIQSMARSMVDLVRKFARAPEVDMTNHLHD